jgi:hypothetical protein
MTYKLFAHTRGICDLCVLNKDNIHNNRNLITVGADGFIMMFDPNDHKNGYKNSYSCTDGITCISSSSSVCKKKLKNISF